VQKHWFLHLLFLAEAAIAPRSARRGSIMVAVSARTEYKAGRQKEEDMATGHTVHYRFHHRHLIVADVTKTVAFYENTLGAKKVQETEFRGRPIVRLELDGMPLTISQQIHTRWVIILAWPLITLRQQSVNCGPRARSSSQSRQT